MRDALRCLGSFGALALLSSVSLSAQAVGPVGVLFQEREPLTLRIEAPFDQILDDRDQDSEERDGQLIIIQPDGSEAAYPLEVRTRGNFRLQSSNCRFPPLRLDVPRSQMDGTPFEGQDKLKLVTHCRDGERFEQNTVKEYLVYRIYNLMTEASFQVRLARITYVDTSGENDPVEQWGFMIESEEALAERLGGEVVEDRPEGVHPARIGADDAARLDLFQYMVGNTDYSIYGQHNVISLARSEALNLPVPYDFDWTGLVNAPYARPDPSLPIRNVRRRLYRGVCRPRMDYAPTNAAFLARKADVTALIENEAALMDDVREDVLDYLNEFWETLEDPGRAEREIERACRPL